MEDKTLLEDLIQTCSMLIESHSVTPSNGSRKFGAARWNKVCRWLHQNADNDVYVRSGYIEMIGTSTADIEALRDDCRLRLEEIHKAEHDRKLSNEVKYATLDDFKKTNIRAWVAIAISVIALIVSIFK